MYVIQRSTYVRGKRNRCAIHLQRSSGSVVKAMVEFVSTSIEYLDRSGPFFQPFSGPTEQKMLALA